MAHRILHVVRSLGRYSPTSDLLALASALPSDDFEQQVVSLDNKNPFTAMFDEAGIDCHSMGRRWAYDPTTLFRLRAHIRKHQPRIVHTWDETSREYVEPVAPKTSGPALVALRDHFFLGGPRMRWPVPKRWRHLPERMVVASESLCAALRNQPSDSTEYVVIPSGVALADEPAESREQLLGELHLPDDARLVAVAGPLLPRFGVKELIWAADMVRVLHPNMRFLVVGDGAERDHLEQFSRTAADPANICFLGDSDRWPDLAAHVEIYWQGTEADATSPTTMLQAMAAGVPVVASDTPMHREMIADGQTGFLVGVDDRAGRTRVTDQLLNDHELARTIGTAGRQHQQLHFSLDTRAENFVALYRELLSP